MAEMLRRHRVFPAATRRTLERRVRVWQALHGPERDVTFRQEHPPGQQGLSDFTDANPLGVTIASIQLDDGRFVVSPATKRDVRETRPTLAAKDPRDTPPTRPHTWSCLASRRRNAT